MRSPLNSQPSTAFAATISEIYFGICSKPAAGFRLGLMHLGGAARLYGYNTIWRATGSLAAGRKLLEALDSRDEDLQSFAGMLLAQAGKKAEPLLDEALAKREHLPLVLAILGDIGDPKYEPMLRRFADDPDPLVAAAAHDALRVLKAQSSEEKGK